MGQKLASTWLKATTEELCFMRGGTDQAFDIQNCVERNEKTGEIIIRLNAAVWDWFLNESDQYNRPNTLVISPNSPRPQEYVPPPPPPHPSGLDARDFQGSSLEHRIIRWMLTHDNPAAEYMPTYSKHYELFTKPSEVNIIYVRSLSHKLQPLSPTPNHWDDMRLILTWVNGQPKITFQQQATIDPGRYWVAGRRSNSKGAAQIVLGQWQSWTHGFHLYNKYGRSHPCLFQTRTVGVHRDWNQDFSRIGDKVYLGLFGINQHHGHNASYYSVDANSAGCTVGRDVGLHNEFLAITKKDPKYIDDSQYRYNSTFLDSADLFGDENN